MESDPAIVLDPCGMLFDTTHNTPLLTGVWLSPEGEADN